MRPGLPGALTELPGTGIAEDEVELGRISGIFGVRGELRLFLHNPKGTALRKEVPVVLVDRDGSRFATRISARSGAGKRVLGQIRGIDSPEVARDLMELVIVIKKSDLPPRGSDEFYVHELEGLGAYVGDEPVGQVETVHATDGGDLIEIVAGEDAWFIPVEKRWILGVDLAAGRIQLSEDALTGGEGDEVEDDAV